MAPLPPSPPSGSPRLLKSSSGSEWNVVVQRNIKSSLLLLLAISTVAAFSILYSSRSLTVARTADEALTQSPLLAALDMSSRIPEDDDNYEPGFPGDDNVTPELSTPEDVAMPPAANSSAAAPSAAEQTDGPNEAAMQLEEKCDISRGKWVREPNGPVYTNLTCPMLPDFKNCQKFGKDDGHLYWRWQPDGCELTRFVPERFLDVVRGKRLAFIGDSLARNQIDSLLCLLSQAEAPTEVYSDAFDKFRTWHFPAHNFTLMVMWTEFYAHAVPVVGADGKPTSSFDIHLDRLGADWTSRLPGLDYAVISGGNWFFRVNYLWEGGRRVGCLNCAGNDANLPDLGVAYAVRRVVRAAVEGIAQCRGCKSGLVTFLRTYSPDHFEHGSWFNGGYCNRTAPLAEREVSTATRRFGVLDVTKAMMMRADGHPDTHFDSRWRRNGSDCLHWCLPGPVDMWNGVLLQRLAEVTPPPIAR